MNINTNSLSPFLKSPEIFETQWQNKIGKREKFYLTRNAIDGSVKAQILSQSIFSRSAHFFEKLFSKHPDVSKERFKILKEKKFINISHIQFEQEIQLLQDLSKKNHSTQYLLSQIEKDFQSFLSSNNEETYTPANLRSELQTLLDKINEQESSLNTPTFKNLQSTLKCIKDVVLNTFNHLEKISIDHSNSSIKQKEALQEIKNQYDESNQNFNQIHQLLLEESLQNEIQSFNKTLQSFSPPIIKEWQEHVKLWNETPIPTSSLAEIQERKNSMEKLKASICDSCKQELMATIQNTLYLLKEELTNEEASLFPDSQLKKNSGTSSFKTFFWKSRIDAWNSLAHTLSELNHDLTSIYALKQEIEEKQISERYLIITLNTPFLQETFFQHILSLIQPPKNFSNFIKSFLPSINHNKKPELVLKKKLIDETLFFYINDTVENIQKKANEIFGLIESSHLEKSRLREQFRLFETTSYTESDLEKFLENLLTTTENIIETETSNTNRENLKKASQKLKGLNDTLTILLKSQIEHRKQFVNQIKLDYAVAFDNSTQESILLRAQKIANELFSSQEKSRTLVNLKKDWQAARKSTIAPLKTLQKLKEFADLHQEYAKIIHSKEEEIKNFADSEQQQIKAALGVFKKVIESLNIDDDSINEAMITDYKIKLIKANQAFNDFYSIKTEKSALRTSISQTIDSFLEEIKTLDSQINEIEALYAIKLISDHKNLEKISTKIREWNETGWLPTPYLHYVPKFSLKSILYYMSSFLPTSKSSIDDLSLRELKLYIERLKVEIEIQRKALSHTYISSAYQALSIFKKEMDIAKSHIDGLTSATLPTNDKESQTSPHQKDLPKLQFYNAVITTEKLKAIEANQKTTIRTTPQLKKIYHQLNADIPSVKTTLNQSKHQSPLALPLQIEQLANHPEQQKRAKLAFIQMLTTKMSSHANDITSKLKHLEAHPQIYQYMMKLIQKAKLEMEKQLSKSAPELIPHANSWLIVKNSNDKTAFNPLAMHSDLNVNAFSIKNLRDYASNIDRVIKKNNDHLTLMFNTHKKIKAAVSELDEKTEEIKKFINALNKRNQLVYKEKLENILSAIHRSFKKISNSPPPNRKPGLWNYVLSLITQSNLSANSFSLHLYRQYQRKVQKAIAKLEANQKEIAKSQDLSIPDQLALIPPPEIAQELCSRFHKKYAPLIDTARKHLERYVVNGNLFTSYSRYIPIESALYREIEHSINKKLNELKNYEIGYKTSTWPFSSPTPISDLTPEEMKKYAQKLTEIESSFTNDLNKKFHIEKIAIAQANYKKIHTQQASQLIASLKKKSQFLQAHRLEKNLFAITKLETDTWKNKVKKASQLKDLIIALNHYKEKIKFLIDNFPSKSEDLSLENQIRSLLKIKAQERSSGYLSCPQKLDEINQDLKIIQKRLDADIKKKHKQQYDNLYRSLTSIEQLFFEYRINFISKNRILNQFNEQLKKFSNQTILFPVTKNFFFPNTMKTILNMTPKEILIASPENKHEKLIAQSNERVTSIFNFTPILEAQTAYKKMIQKAEKTLLNLEEKQQFSHAAHFQNVIREAALALENQKRIPVNTIENLNELITFLEDQTSLINKEILHVSKKKNLTPHDQAGLITLNSYRVKLEPCLRQEIVDSLKREKETIKAYSKILQNLVRKINFPQEWQSNIHRELERYKKRLEDSVLIPNGSWGFRSNKPFSDLSLDELIQASTNLHQTLQNNNPIQEYHLMLINNQFKKYVGHLHHVQELKIQWKEENNQNKIRAIEALINEKRSRLRTFFQNPNAFAPQENVNNIEEELVIEEWNHIDIEEWNLIDIEEIDHPEEQQEPVATGHEAPILEEQEEADIQEVPIYMGEGLVFPLQAVTILGQMERFHEFFQTEVIDLKNQKINIMNNNTL